MTQGTNSGKCALLYPIKPSSLDKLPEGAPWKKRYTQRFNQYLPSSDYQPAGLTEPSQPALEVSTLLTAFMDGLSVQFKVMESVNSREDLKPGLQTHGTHLSTL